MKHIWQQGWNDEWFVICPVINKKFSSNVWKLLYGLQNNCCPYCFYNVREDLTEIQILNMKKKIGELLVI